MFEKFIGLIWCRDSTAKIKPMCNSFHNDKKKQIIEVYKLTSDETEAMVILENSSIWFTLVARTKSQILDVEVFESSTFSGRSIGHSISAAVERLKLLFHADGLQRILSDAEQPWSKKGVKS